MLGRGRPEGVTLLARALQILAPLPGSGVDQQPLRRRLPEVYVRAAGRGPADPPRLLRGGPPQHLGHLLGDFGGAVHGPDDVQVLVALDDLAVDEVDVGLAPAVETPQQPPPVDQVVLAGDPERHGWGALVVPCVPPVLLMVVPVAVAGQLGDGLRVGPQVEVVVFLLVFLVLELTFGACREDAALGCEALPAEPPSHALGADERGRELEHAVPQVELPPLVGPVEEEGEDAVAHVSVETAWHDCVHFHHEWDERVDPWSIVSAED